MDEFNGMMPMAISAAIPRPGGSYGPNTQAVEHMRMLAYLQRQSGRAPSSGSGRGMPMGPMDLGMGAMNPATMDMGQMNELLGQYGQQMPEHPATNAFLPSTGFFGNHPRLSGAIESGLLGAANVSPSNTIGEGISNAIRGGLSGPMERARILNSQYQQPFQAAMQVQQLLHGGYEDKDLAARTNLANNQAAYYGDKAGQEADRNATRLSALAPRPTEGGAWVYNKDMDKWEFNEGPGGKAVHAFGSQPSALHPYLASMFGLKPDDTPSAAQIGAAQKAMLKDQTGLRGVGPGINQGGDNARQGNQFAQADRRNWYTQGALSNKSKFSEWKAAGFTKQPSQAQMDDYNNRRWQQAGSMFPDGSRGGPPPPAAGSDDQAIGTFLNNMLGQTTPNVRPNSPIGK